jgi:hypothetical protein
MLTGKIITKPYTIYVNTDTLCTLDETGRTINKNVRK